MIMATSHERGFTLIELLVAIGILALMAGLSWRGLDGMAKAQAQLQQRADTVLTLQAGLSQWAADLDALVQLPIPGSGLGWPRPAHHTAQHGCPGDGLLVVAWSARHRWHQPVAALADHHRFRPGVIYRPQTRRPMGTKRQ